MLYESIHVVYDIQFTALEGNTKYNNILMSTRI
jgi:hypothetical protein